MEGLVNLGDDYARYIAAVRESIPPAVLAERRAAWWREMIFNDHTGDAIDHARTVGAELGRRAFNRFMNAWLARSAPPGAGHVLYASCDYHGATLLRKGIGWEEVDYGYVPCCTYHWEDVGKPQVYQGGGTIRKIDHRIFRHDKPSAKRLTFYPPRTLVTGGRVCVD